MTKLLFQELKDSLSHKFNFILNERQIIVGFYPYLFIRNLPEGLFDFQVIKNGRVLFLKTFSSIEIQESLKTNSNFIRVFYPVIPDSPIALEKGEYTASITSRDYSFKESSFIGWIKEHEDLSNEIPEGLKLEEFPLSMRIKTNKEGLRMRIATFADGFVSASDPTINGQSNMPFEIKNNTYAFTKLDGFELDKSKFATAFALVEVTREMTLGEVKETFRQSIEVTFFHDGNEWKIIFGNYSGSDILKVGDIENSTDVSLYIHQDTEELRYKSGNMIGDVYFGEMKINLTRMIK